MAKATKSKGKTKAKASAKVASKGEATTVLGGLDLAAMVGGKKKTGSKKSTKPAVTVDLKDAEGNLVADNYLKGVELDKAGASAKKKAFALLAPLLEQERIEVSRRTGEYAESLSVNHALIYTVSHKYFGIDSDNSAELLEVFGPEDFKKYFRLDQQTSLNMAELEGDPEFLKSLFEVIVAHLVEDGRNPAEVVEVKQVLKPTKALTQDRVMQPAIEAKFKEAKEAGLVEPAKAVLKEGK